MEAEETPAHPPSGRNGKTKAEKEKEKERERERQERERLEREKAEKASHSSSPYPLCFPLIIEPKNTLVHTLYSST